jgi:dihydroflavonol-4-reductase
MIRHGDGSTTMTVVVTGASGHLGSNLVRELLERGESVRALVRKRDPESLVGLDIEQVEGDVRDRDSLEAAFKGADIVYHLAAIISIVGDPDGMVKAVNVEGAENTARAALKCGVRRMVHTCSVHAFNMRLRGEPVSETTPRCVNTPGVHNAYDRSKAEGERRVRKVVEEGLDAVVVHPTGVIGPWDFMPSRMGQVFISLYKRQLPSLINGGFDFVDVRDVIDGTIAAAQKGRTNESYLLSGTYRRVAELGKMAEEVTGVRPPRFISPMWLARVGAPFMQMAANVASTEPIYTAEGLEALRSNPELDNSKARRELDYDPRPTQESVRDIYRWFAEHGRLPADAVRGDAN